MAIYLVLADVSGKEETISNGVAVRKCYYCLCFTLEEDYSYHQSVCNPKQESV